jgi:hypothetical protein
MTIVKFQYVAGYLTVSVKFQYLTSADLLPSPQSGFRPGHSTETAVLRVLSDILQAVDREDVAALILLDLSAAFDMVGHNILLQRLRISYGIDDTAYRWFQSYLYSICAPWTVNIFNHASNMRRSTRFGARTYTICVVHRYNLRHLRYSALDVQSHPWERSAIPWNV